MGLPTPPPPPKLARAQAEVPDSAEQPEAPTKARPTPPRPTKAASQPAAKPAPPPKVSKAAPAPPPVEEEVPAWEEEPETSSGRAVAPVARGAEVGTAVRETSLVPVVTGPMEKMAAEMGFAGLDFGFGVTPIVKLEKGKFIDTDKKSYGSEFYFVADGSRPKYLFATDVSDKAPEYAFVYSYDGVTDHTGKPVRHSIEAWAKKGITHQLKIYTEVSATLPDGDSVLLSIPATSVRRFAKAFKEIVKRNLKPNEVWIKASVGEEITSGVKPFDPWEFTPVFDGNDD